MNNRILVRFGPEIFVKSRRTRKQFVRHLADNISDALASHAIAHEVTPRWDRIRLFVDDVAGAVSVLSRVSGTGPVMPIDYATSPGLSAIVEEGERLFGEAVEGKKFAVRARRRGDHPFRSRDVEVQLGAALDRHADHVDLTDPDITVYVEIDEEEAIFYTDRLDGMGGLPIGTQSRAISLISGGFDSAVASWLTLKRGVELDYVFCNLAGKAYQRSVLRLTKMLADMWSYGYQPRLYVVDFHAPVDEMKTHVDSSYWQVVLKRLMYRSAARIAHRLGAEAIVTGEAIGQVSSQTMTNLRAIDVATDLPVLRPLVGMDKQDIIAQARQIGTATISEKVKEYCAISSDAPVTAARVSKVDHQEEEMNRSIVENAIASAEAIDLRSVDLAEHAASYLFTEKIPSDAVVIDCQSPSGYRQWHVDGARHRNPWALQAQFRQMDKEPTYVLYCERGMQTAYIAETMQEEGYDAYSFRGGVQGVKTYVEKRRNDDTPVTLAER
jgi:thiamine biosynthesis protein ThiI